MIDRRRFLHGLVAAAAAPAACAGNNRSRPPFAALLPDPLRILDLPAGFDCQVISSQGDVMDDGLLVPGCSDGMAAFAGADGNIVLVCNHENWPGDASVGPWGPNLERLASVRRQLIYDAGFGITPGTGGTTTIVYDPHNRRVLRRHLSLAGTEWNCAGGPTPWGSWLSCEESFQDEGISFQGGAVLRRERRHGYVFEVPSGNPGLVEPVALKAMGRFEHEAAAVSGDSRVVYMTEDRHESLFYRFLPRSPGRLADGGRLQALAINGSHGHDTRNWFADGRVALRRAIPVSWVDLDNVDSDSNDLRLRGREKGAAIFARGEGLCSIGRDFAFGCTIGGPDRLGQVFLYSPSQFEGKLGEPDHPGQLQLLAEATPDSLLRNADNMVAAPWGDLLVCEDTADHCGIVGVRPDGSQYMVADNAYSNSELAGVCFSPDGSIMFVNVQYPGQTLAISGPWPGS
jgi:secreted PhoX family phosphatase